MYEYLEKTYDLEKVKKIYLNADGGGWIQAGKELSAQITYVLDEFHLKKYLLKLTGHMMDSAEDARKELCSAIKDGTKADFKRVVKRITGYARTENEQRRIKESAAYILSNFSAAQVRLGREEGVRGCSAEGHVSHVLSSRMSSRPMGWSRLGVDKMSHLRAYYWNGGDMLELVRSQKEKLQVAVGAENEVLSCEEIQKSERARRSALGKYVESISHSIRLQTRQKIYFQHHIWDL